MTNFRNTKRMTQSQIENISTLPISEGTTYFATDTGTLYKDINSSRIAIGEIKFTIDYMSGYNNSQTKIRSCFLVDKVTGETEEENIYNLWYINDKGDNHLLVDGEGDLLYSGGTGINIDADLIEIDDTVMTKSGLNVYTAPEAFGSSSTEEDALEIYQAVAGYDSFIIFKNSTNFSVNFGLDNATDDLFVGGLSIGEVKNKIFHEGNFTDNHDDWDAAYQAVSTKINILNGTATELTVNNDLVGDVSLIVNSITGTTANLQELKVNNVNKAYFDKDGILYIPALYDIDNLLYYVNPSASTSLNVAGDIITAGDLAINGGNITFSTSELLIGASDNRVAILGDLDVRGTTTSINTEELDIEDNIILINSNQTGTPSSLLIGGLEIERGDLTNYQFAFVEATGDFRIGETGDLQPVLTRDETTNLVEADILTWDAIDYRAVGKTIAELGLALDNTVVHLAEAEEITGIKTFSAIPVFNGGATGSTAPFTVDSTFKVTNLNADLLDGYDTSIVDANSSIPVRSAAGDIQSNTFNALTKMLIGKLVIEETTSYIDISVLA